MTTAERFYDIVKDFDTAMLVTHAADALHARPMAVAEFEEGGDVYFATSITSPKVAEIEQDARVLIVFQGSSRYASVTGSAHVVRDQALVDQLWSPAWKTWFPEGKDDPDLCILRIEPQSAEYWDNSGTKGLKYLFEGAKAVLQGRKPAVDKDQNAQVKL